MQNRNAQNGFAGLYGLKYKPMAMSKKPEFHYCIVIISRNSRNYFMINLSMKFVVGNG